MANRRTIRFTFVAILVLIGLVVGTLWQNRPTGWSGERQLTQGVGDYRLVDLATDPEGDALHLVWENTRDNATEIYYKHSPDGGVTWGPDIRLGSLTAGAEPEPRIVTNGEKVLVFFSNWTSTGEHIFFVSGADVGTNFSPPQQLTNDVGDQSNVAVTFVGSTINLVYQDYLNGDERVFYLKSLDAGLSWQRKIALTDTSGAEDRYLAIAALQNKVFVTWCRLYQRREAIYVRASLDSGTSWRPEIQVSEYGPPSYEDFPDIATNGTQLHIVWTRQGIRYARSSDFGSTWSGPISLTNSTREYLAPRLAVANSKVQVVAAAILTLATLPRNTVDSELYYLNSEDGGQTWTKPYSLTSHKFGAWSLAPVIRSLHDATYIAWEDNRNGRLAVFFLSKPDFAVLNRFEWQLFISVTITLAITTITYLMLESRTLRTNHRRVRRPSRSRRNKGVKKHTRPIRRYAKI